MNTARQDYFRRLLPVLLILVLVVFAVWSIALGPVPIAWSELLPGQAKSLSQTLVFELRLPRLVLAVAVGFALGISGAASQGLFRNPLADPSLIGIGAGASLGATLAVVVVTFVPALTAVFPVLQNAMAFTCALLTTAIVYLLAVKVANHANTRVVTMLLAGVAIAAFASALTSFCKYLITNDGLRLITFWQMGDLNNHSWIDALWVCAISLIAAIILLTKARSLNALLLGEQEAADTGVNVTSITWQVIVLVALSVASAVSVVGAIGFIGLLAPHMVRLLVGPNHQYVLINAGLAGAVLLVMADIASRSVMPPSILPVGILTSALGAPVFLWMLLTSRGGYRWGN